MSSARWFPTQDALHDFRPHVQIRLRDQWVADFLGDLLYLKNNDSMFGLVTDKPQRNLLEDQIMSYKFYNRLERLTKTVENDSSWITANAKFNW